MKQSSTVSKGTPQNMFWYNSA